MTLTPLKINLDLPRFRRAFSYTSMAPEGLTVLVNPQSVIPLRDVVRRGLEGWIWQPVSRPLRQGRP